MFISDRFDDLLAGTTEGGHIDLVVFDTPPVLAVADASELAVRADEVLLVVADNETSRRAAQRSRAVLDGVGSDAALGLVVNKVPASSSLFNTYRRPVPRLRTVSLKTSTVFVAVAGVTVGAGVVVGLENAPLTIALVVFGLGAVAALGALAAAPDRRGARSGLALCHTRGAGRPDER